MSFSKINYLSAVLVVSKDAAKLANFYKNVLKVPLVDEQHDDEPLHYGCELGDIHFAIHPADKDQNIRQGFTLTRSTRNFLKNRVQLKA